MAVAFELPASVDDALSAPSERFLDGLADALDPDTTESVLLFGSVRSGEATEKSDVDLVIVLDDASSDGEARRVREVCEDLAAEHLDPGGSPGHLLERAIDRATGMFRSGFVLRADDVRSGRFHTIFETSRIAYLVAPWRTVLASAFEEAEPIYGTTVEPRWNRIGRPETRRVRELFRSWLTTALLGTAQPAYALVSDRSQQYAMEAHKWALYNCAYLLLGEPTTLEAAIRTAPGTPRFDEWLLTLRRRPEKRYAYLLAVPVYVTYLHVATARGLFGRTR